jgi:hypothetical protein
MYVAVKNLSAGTATLNGMAIWSPHATTNPQVCHGSLKDICRHERALLMIRGPHAAAGALAGLPPAGKSSPHMSLRLAMP